MAAKKGITKRDDYSSFFYRRCGARERCCPLCSALIFFFFFSLALERGRRAGAGGRVQVEKVFFFFLSFRPS